MAKRGHGLRVSIPIRPPGPPLERVRERGKPRRAPLVSARARRERLAVDEDELEVLPARGRVLLELVRDGLQERAGGRWGRGGVCRRRGGGGLVGYLDKSGGRNGVGGI